MIRIPEFFVVGAPRCGTTGLWRYLDSHPDFDLPRKEIHFFGSDLVNPYRPTVDRYRRYFEHKSARYTGEVAVWYLFSEVAAQEIKAYAPEAKVVAMVRSPATAIPALHAHNLMVLEEDHSDLATALALEPSRRKGLAIPARSVRPWTTRYREIYSYSEQLERYVETFGRDRIHVIVAEDFWSEPREEWTRLLDFFGAESSFAPRFGRYNSRAVSRSVALARGLTAVTRFGVGVLGSRNVPESIKMFARGTASGIRHLNRRPAAPISLDPALERLLLEEALEEAVRLEDLLGQRVRRSWVQA